LFKICFWFSVWSSWFHDQSCWFERLTQFNFSFFFCFFISSFDFRLLDLKLFIFFFHFFSLGLSRIVGYHHFQVHPSYHHLHIFFLLEKNWLAPRRSSYKKIYYYYYLRSLALSFSFFPLEQKTPRNSWHAQRGNLNLRRGLIVYKVYNIVGNHPNIQQINAIAYFKLIVITERK